MNLGKEAYQWQTSILSDLIQQILIKDVAGICLEYGETTFMIFERLLLRQAWSIPKVEWAQMWTRIPDCALKKEYAALVESIQQRYALRDSFEVKLDGCLSQDSFHDGICHRAQCYYLVHSCICHHPIMIKNGIGQSE